MARAEFLALAALGSAEAAAAFATVRDRLRPGTSTSLRALAAALEQPDAGAAASDALAAAVRSPADRALADELLPQCTNAAATFALARLIHSTAGSGRGEQGL